MLTEYFIIRYIGLAFFFPGTAGTFIRSKRFSRKNAVSPVHHLTGTGLKVRNIQVYPLYCNCLTFCLMRATDAPDVYGSSFFSDNSPTSGLGGWGDPAHDFQVPSGGFSNLHVSYPSPHIIRRNFTLQPWFALASSSTLITDPAYVANVSFTEKEVNKMVDGFVGDFKGFQAYFEAINVRF